MRKNLILLVGKSGSGKSTVVKYLEDYYKVKSVQSYTTRKPRYEGETGHTFISMAEYLKLKNKVATTYYNGRYYCATQEQCELSDIYIIDHSGVKSFLNNYCGSKPFKVVYLDVGGFTRLYRMLKRGDGLKAAVQRIRFDRQAFTGIKNEKNTTVIKGGSIPTVALKIYNMI